MPTIQSPHLRAESLTFAYRRGPAVLDGLNWSVGRGVTGLLGPNGAGKTTLLECLLSLRSPRNGRVDIAGKIGYVPQSPQFPRELRVRDAVAYAGWLCDIPRGALSGAADEAIDAVGLTDKAGVRVKALSGGQLRRMAIAAGIVHRPSLLVLDEPTAGLDPTQRLNVRRAITDLDSVEAIVISTHLLEDVQYMCDRVSLLIDGQIRFDDSREAFEAEFADRRADGHGSGFEIAYEHFVTTHRGRGATDD